MRRCRSESPARRRGHDWRDGRHRGRGRRRHRRRDGDDRHVLEPAHVDEFADDEFAHALDVGRVCHAPREGAAPEPFERDRARREVDGADRHRRRPHAGGRVHRVDDAFAGSLPAEADRVGVGDRDPLAHPDGIDLRLEHAGRDFPGRLEAVVAARGDEPGRRVDGRDGAGVGNRCRPAERRAGRVLRRRQSTCRQQRGQQGHDTDQSPQLTVLSEPGYARTCIADGSVPLVTVEHGLCLGP